MEAHPVRARALWRAAKILGGKSPLRAYLNVSAIVLAGIGLDWTTQRDSFLATNSNDNDFTAHLQSFAALQYLMAGQLYIKAVFGFARADFLPSDPSVSEWRNYMYSGRIRLMYLY